MAQYIKQGNIFGRIGENLGKGLAEQLPAAVERGRLAAGLKSFEQDYENLTPIQQLARLSATGASPQTIASFQELAKNQNQGNAYRRSAGGNPNPGQQQDGRQPQSSPGSQAVRDMQFGNFQQQGGQQRQNMPPNGPVNNRQQTPNMSSNENTPQVVEGNVFNEQNVARTPWTPQQRNQTVADYIDQGFLPEQAKQLQSDDEARDLAEPAVHKQRQEDIKTSKAQVSESLNRHLEKKLQKTGENLYKDVEGKMILNAEKGMIRDLIKNPKADIDNIANDWSERIYNTAIAKDKLRTLGATTGIESIFKGSTQEKKLKEYQDIFKRSGNLDEFKNILMQKNTRATKDDKGSIVSPEKRGLGLSEQAASFVAYPPNSNIKQYISNFKPSHAESRTKDQEARKAAIDISSNFGPDDSVQAIVRSFLDKDPFFDQQAFIDQFSDDKDRIGMNERQKLELAQGPSNLIGNWADLLFLKTFGR